MPPGRSIRNKYYIYNSVNILIQLSSNVNINIVFLAIILSIKKIPNKN